MLSRHVLIRNALLSFLFHWIHRSKRTSVKDGQRTCHLSNWLNKPALLVAIWLLNKVFYQYFSIQHMNLGLCRIYETTGLTMICAASGIHCSTSVSTVLLYVNFLESWCFILNFDERQRHIATRQYERHILQDPAILEKK